MSAHIVDVILLLLKDNYHCNEQNCDIVQPMVKMIRKTVSHAVMTNYAYVILIALISIKLQTFRRLIGMAKITRLLDEKKCIHLHVCVWKMSTQSSIVTLTT